MKKLAAEKALEYVEDGMILGLGTGSTVKFAVEKLGELVKKGLSIKGIPTSIRTKKLAESLNIPIVDINEYSNIDLTIDGADEVDSFLNLIKGGGGALTREKIVAFHSEKVIIIIDESKVVKCLGMNFPIPVENTKYGWQATKKALEELGCTAELRTIVGETYITDNQNYIVDCDFGRIDEPDQLEQDINAIPGVLENGLFIDLVDDVIVGSNQGVMSLEKTRLIPDNKI